MERQYKRIVIAFLSKLLKNINCSKMISKNKKIINALIQFIRPVGTMQGRYFIGNQLRQVATKNLFGSVGSNPTSVTIAIALFCIKN